MCLAGLSTDEAIETQEMTHDPLNWNNYHNLDVGAEVADDDTIYKDTSGPRANEYTVPGWGTVPGSSSRKVRVKAEVLQGGGSGNYAAVRVKFKFPLLLPLAGKIISWSVAHPELEASVSTYNDKTDTWTGDYYAIHTGWQGGKEYVMDDDGNGSDRSYATYGQEGRFPYIELTETCVLPRPYLTTKFKDNRYNYDGGGGS